MNLSRRSRRILSLGAILLGILVSAGMLSQFGALDESVQPTVHDAIASRAVRAPDSSVRIVILAIDDPTIKAYGRWPLPRRAYTEVLTALRDIPTRVIAFDVLFADPGSDAKEDAQLAQAITAAGNVVLAMQGQGSARAENSALHFDQALLPLDMFRRAAAEVASVTTVQDADSRVRRSPLVVEDAKGQRYYNLAYEVAAQRLGTDASKTRITPGALVLPLPAGSLAREYTIPVDASGAMSIDFVAPPATPTYEQQGYCQKAGEFCVISLVDLARGKVPSKLLEGAIILIGAHSASSVPDYYPTPTSGTTQMYGVEIWANTVHTLLTGRFVALRESNLLTFGWMLLLALLGALLIIRFRLLGLGLAFVALLAYAVLAYATAIATLTGPATTSATPSIGYVALFAPFWWMVVLSYLTVEERAAVKSTERAFGLAVTPEIARHILKLQEQGALALGGEVRMATVLFGDIRGFTTLSEGKEPTELLGTLNHVFEGLVNIVRYYDGTVNKYNGDNIMVIWGAPIPHAQHALKAVECALTMQKYLVLERAKTGVDIAFGIGINTGEVVAGLLGAQGRFEYTVIGDNVNVASRLTGASLAKADTVVVSDSTLRALGTDVVAVDLGETGVKGRAKAVRAYRIDRIGSIEAPKSKT